LHEWVFGVTPEMIDTVLQMSKEERAMSNSIQQKHSFLISLFSLLSALCYLFFVTFYLNLEEA
jgi:hypothetical protein